ncbi:hypothetical protein Tco_1179399, partial [Tanacetum coccineum]
LKYKSELIPEFFSTFRFGEVVTDLDTAGALQFQLGRARRRLSWRQFILALGLHNAEEMETVGFGAYWAESTRQIPDKGDLKDYWIGISSARDLLGTAPSYTSIRDSILRLCHRLITCSIAGRSQAPEKVTVTDLFYLRGMNFVARLAKHFGLLTKERIQGLTAIAPALPVIYMAELVRLQICMEIDDTWAWVAQRPERQPDAAAGGHGAAENAPTVDEDMPQAVPPPPRTQGERIARLEEEVHRMRELLQGQSEVLDHIA